MIHISWEPRNAKERISRTENVQFQKFSSRKNISASNILHVRNLIYEDGKCQFHPQNRVVRNFCKKPLGLPAESKILIKNNSNTEHGSFLFHDGVDDPLEIPGLNGIARIVERIGNHGNVGCVYFAEHHPHVVVT